jgi:uncharacterized peroxidase-related enzyme
MAYINTIAMSDIDESVRAMYARQQDHCGYVPSYAKLFCYRPELMKLWADLLSGIRQNIDLRRYELVTFAAAVALRSTFCSLAFGAKLTRFLSREDVEALARGEAPSCLSAAEVSMIEFARKVAEDAISVTASDVAKLHEHGFSDAEIFDITAVAAARAFWTKLVDSLGVEGDAPLASPGSAFVEAVSVGRPAAFVEPERLAANQGAASDRMAAT